MYDVILIGAGPGGYVAAVQAGRRGLKTLVIEKKELGGVCLHSGCIPTKALLASAGRLLDVKDAGTHGISIPCEPEVDWPAMQKRKDKVVSRLTKGIETLFKQNKVEWKQGEAEVISPEEVKVNGETIQTKHLILATGAHAVVPDLPGLDALRKEKTALTPTELLFVEEVPKQLLIAGDNVFAVEYASLFAALGTDVTILAPSARLLPYMDEELSAFLSKELGRQKIRITTEAKITAFEQKIARFSVAGKEDSVSFDIVLLSLETAPNLTGLEALNLQKNDRGFVQVDAQMKTSVKNVYAIGDLIGKYPLAHVASAEGGVAVQNIAGISRTMQYEKLPMAVYSLPEVASVGLTEEKARAQHEDVQVHKYPMTANGKALAEGDAKGFVKILSAGPYDEVIGMHIAGNKATDLIAQGVLALQLEATVHDLAAATHAHPTPAEIIMEAARLDS